jgi:hypothetical protein
VVVVTAGVVVPPLISRDTPKKSLQLKILAINCNYQLIFFL